MRDLRTAGVVIGGGLLAYVLYRIASTPGSSEVSRQAAPTGARGLFDSLLRGGESFKLDSDKPVYVVTPGKWLSTPMTEAVNMMPKKGARYMAIATAPNFMGYVIVEGTLVSDVTSTGSPMDLKIDRVVSVSGTQIPAVPFTLQIPASPSSIESLYMVPTRWESLHPSSVSEEARESTVKPAPGTKTRYVMREANKYGNAVLVLEGLAFADTNKSWPKEAGEPDPEHVLVSADTVIRAVRGDENVSLPGAFVVPVENLIA